MADYHRPLQRYLDAGLRVLVECRRCSEARSFNPRDLAARFGAGRDPANLRFVCIRCGSRQARVGPDLLRTARMLVACNDNGARA